MKGYLDFRYGIYSETIPLLILSAFLSYSLRKERLSGLYFNILRKNHEIYTVLCIINYFIVKKDKEACRQDFPKRRFYAC